MTKEIVRIIEELRKISDSEWKEVKEILLKSNVVTTKSSTTEFEGIVHHICKELGIPAHVKGFKYVQRAILLTIDNSEMGNRITKMLYPTLAKEFGSTPSRVERAIRHAIGLSMDRLNKDLFNEIFSYTYSSEKGKPTNSEFITGVADYILNG